MFLIGPNNVTADLLPENGHVKLLGVAADGERIVLLGVKTLQRSR
jgi:hypothetical protein